MKLKISRMISKAKIKLHIEGGSKGNKGQRGTLVATERLSCVHAAVSEVSRYFHAHTLQESVRNSSDPSYLQMEASFCV